MDFTSNSILRQSKKFMSLEHKAFRDIYFGTFSESELALIKHLYYQDLAKQQKIIWFCKWFQQWFPIQDYIQVLEDYIKL